MQVIRLYTHDILAAERVVQKFGAYAEGETMPAADRLTRLLQNQTCYVIAAMENDEPLGFILAYRFPSLYMVYDIAYLYDIEVDRNYRNKGIGRELIKRFLEEVGKDNVKEVWLGTGVNNLPAQRVFKLTGARKNDETFFEYFYYPE